MKKWSPFLGVAALCGALAWRSAAQIAPLTLASQVAPASPAATPQPDSAPQRIVPPVIPRFVPRFPRPLPTFPMPPRVTELRLEKQRASVEIRGPIARTHLSQTLRNPTTRALEGSYFFALPDGAAISNFAMTMGGKRLEAEILDGEQARQIYQGIVQKLRDPAILEFAGRGLARVKIFPVPAGQTVQIELDYSQSAASGRLTIPLRSPQNARTDESNSGAISGDNAAPASVEISLEGTDLRGIYSPTHATQTRRVGQKTLVSGEFKNSDRDFSLLWTRGGEKIGLDLFASQNDGQDGTFLLIAAPDAALSSAQIEAKDVIFVFDTSGSMEGAKIEQARRALKTLLGNLGPRDRFGIVTFSSAAQTFRSELIDATPANLSAARGFATQIKALGGTNIGEALQTAFKMTQKSARPQQIVFLTDGQPTVGQTDIDALLRDAEAQNTAQARVFSFGLGHDVNARLLDALASDNRGASDYVAPGEDIEVKVGALYEKIAYPVLSDGTLDFGGASVYDVYPPRLPDLFKGAQVTVFGRFRGAAPQQIALSGQSKGAKSRFSGHVAPYDSSDLPKLWATRKVGYLIEDARRQNRPLAGEVREEILKLSRQYGIVTPLTAALITEDESPAISRFAAPGMNLNLDMAARAAVPSRGAQPSFRARAGIQAQDRVSGGFGGGGRFADSGAAGVATAQKAKELREGRSDAALDVKIVEGKTFELRAGVWTDAAFDAAKSGAARVVKFASPEYFELLKNRRLAAWFSLGARVVVIWEGKVLRVEP